MSYLPFNDISYAQGAYNMFADPNPMIMMKMSGGDGGTERLYFDDQAANNYNNAIRTGKIPFMYHFYGGGDPIAESDYFIKACSPLAVGDGYAVDIERGTWWNPQIDPLAPAKVAAFCNHFHDVTGTWPWVYMNMSTANMYDWSAVFNNCAYWCAAPSYSFDDVLPVNYPQMAQQGSIVNGVDSDAFFGDINQLKRYTYGNGNIPDPQPTPDPEPTPTPPNPDPVPEPTPEPEPTPVPDPQPDPPDGGLPNPEPTPPSTPGAAATIVAIVTAIIAFFVSLLAWFNQ